MSGPSGNQLVCFPSSPDVSLGFVSGDIRTLGKTKLTVSSGSDIKCIISNYLFFNTVLGQTTYHEVNKCEQQKALNLYYFSLDKFLSSAIHVCHVAIAVFTQLFHE